MKIGGKDRPIKFGLNQSALYCKLRGVTITKMNEELISMVQNIDAFRDLIWSALKDGARFNKEEFDYDNLTVGDWFEELTEEEIGNFVKSMTDTLPDSKKKPTKKKTIK